MVAEKSSVSSPSVTEPVKGSLHGFICSLPLLRVKLPQLFFQLHYNSNYNSGNYNTNSLTFCSRCYLISMPSLEDTYHQQMAVLCSRSLPLVKFCGSLDRLPYEGLWLLPPLSSLSPLRIVRWPLRGRDGKLGVRQTHGRQTKKRGHSWVIKAANSQDGQLPPHPPHLIQKPRSLKQRLCRSRSPTSRPLRMD